MLTNYENKIILPDIEKLKHNQYNHYARNGIDKNGNAILVDANEKWEYAGLKDRELANTKKKKTRGRHEQKKF